MGETIGGLVSRFARNRINRAEREVSKRGPPSLTRWESIRRKALLYFTDGTGEVKIGDEVVKVETGDRVIIPVKSVHQVKNTGDKELLYIGLGIALD